MTLSKKPGKAGGNNLNSSATSSFGIKNLTIRGIVMNNNRMAFYESLVRLSFILIFMFALAVGTIGTISICRMLMQSHIPRPEFVTRNSG